MLNIPTFLLSDEMLDDNQSKPNTDIKKLFTNKTTILAHPTPPAPNPNERVLYIYTQNNFCQNCLNLETLPIKPLKLFMGRLIVTLEPRSVTFEPVKDNIENSDIASREYLLSHQFYDSMKQVNIFFKQQITKTKKQLQKISLEQGEDITTTLQKLEPYFNYACPQNAALYWNKEWVIDREALFWSGISSQRGGEVSHLNIQIGSCKIVPQVDELEPPTCKEWRKSIKEYPPLQTCTILGNVLYE